MKTSKVKIAKREFSLAFTLDAMCRLQDTIENFDLGKLSDYVKTPNGLLDMLTILAEQGEMLEGRVLDVDRKWFGNHIPPAPNRIATIQMAILDAFTYGLTMETDDEEEGEMDVVLQQLKKNEAKDA